MADPSTLVESLSSVLESFTSTTSAEPATPLSTFATSTTSDYPRYESPSITTAFVFPTDSGCDDLWTVTSVSQSTNLVIVDKSLENFTSCQPGGRDPGSARRPISYSPGVCPESWTYWSVDTRRLWSPRTRTTATCCAPGYRPNPTHRHPGAAATPCARRYRNTNDFDGKLPGDFPAHMWTGYQIHDPWYITWEASDTSVLPSYMTDVPEGELAWWNPDDGTFLESGGRSSSDGRPSSDDDDDDEGGRSMPIYGWVLIGIGAGIVSLILLCYCCCGWGRGARDRSERSESPVNAETRSVEPSAYQEAINNRRSLHSQRDSSAIRQSRTPSRVSDQRSHMTERTTEPVIRLPTPPREPTPPPPYVAEDSERWAASGDNPDRRGSREGA